jgi:transcriptional regulator GlxA family with amidase domain
MFTAPPAARHSVVQDAVDHIASHLDSDLSSTSLAGRASVSERHLSRLFQSEVGLTPGRYVRRARIEAAAQLLAASDLTVHTIAGRCGFGTAEALRQAFVGAYGVSPSHYRATQASAACRA